MRGLGKLSDHLHQWVYTLLERPDSVHVGFVFLLGNVMSRSLTLKSRSVPTLYILIEATTAPKAVWRGGSGAEASFATSSRNNKAPIAVFMACDEPSAGESREAPPCVVPGCVPSSCGSGGETRPRRFTVFLVFLHIFMPGTSLDDLSKITERGARGLVRAGREGVRCRGEVSEGVQWCIRFVDVACGGTWWPCTRGLVQDGHGTYGRLC